MKRISVLFLILWLTGCGSSDSNVKEDKISLDGTNFTGTWSAIVETEIYMSETGEYQSSNYRKFYYLMKETLIGVTFSTCREYAENQPFGIKTDYHFYMNSGDSGFTLQNDGSLKQTSEFELESEPDLSYKRTEILKHISKDLIIDSGTQILNGPISNSEYNHVCVSQYYSNIGNNKIISIIVPFTNNNIEFYIDLQGEVSPGTYQYNNYLDYSDVSIDVFSNSDIFWNIIHTNTLSPSDVTVTLIESTSSKLSGTFNFTGQDQGIYSGEFEAFINE